MKLSARTKKHLGYGVLALATASIFLGSITPGLLSFVQTYNGATVSETIPGDEAPWGATIVFQGKRPLLERSICGDAACTTVHATAQAELPVCPAYECGEEQLFTTTDLQGQSVYLRARFIGCSPCGWTHRADPSDLVVRDSMGGDSAALCGLQSASITTGTLGDGRPYAQRVCGPVTVPTVPGGTTYVSTRGRFPIAHSMVTTNPTLGSASYTGTLASSQMSPATSITLSAGANSLPATATGAGSFSYQLSYEVGEKPWVSDVTIAGETISATASDNNTDQGDSITKYQFTLLKGEQTDFARTTTESSVTFNNAPDSYTIKARAKDERGVWSDWRVETFTVTGDGGAEETGSSSEASTESAPRTDSNGAVTRGPSTGPMDFAKRVIIGWVRVLNSGEEDGFATAATLPPSWLPDLLAEWLYGDTALQEARSMQAVAT